MVWFFPSVFTERMAHSRTCKRACSQCIQLVFTVALVSGLRCGGGGGCSRGWAYWSTWSLDSGTVTVVPAPVQHSTVLRDPRLSLSRSLSHTHSLSDSVSGSNTVLTATFINSLSVRGRASPERASTRGKSNF